MVDTKKELILDTALNEVGATDSPAGSCNNKYNQAYYGGTVSNPALAWCVVFLWWIFRECDAAELFCDGRKTASVSAAYSRFKQNDQLVDSPQPGDIVFFDFNKNGCPDHIGIVYQAKANGTVVTIEGNTSGTSQTNGGSVQKKIRAKGLIYALARPKYDADEKTIPKESAKSIFIKSVQAACGASVDGVAGPETLAKTVTLSAKRNSRHKAVKAVQIYLNHLGYSCGTADGVAGAKFTAAVKAYQKKKGCIVDGEITAKEYTWKKLLGMK